MIKTALFLSALATIAGCATAQHPRMENLTAQCFAKLPDGWMPITDSGSVMVVDSDDPTGKRLVQVQMIVYRDTGSSVTAIFYPHQLSEPHEAVYALASKLKQTNAWPVSVTWTGADREEAVLERRTTSTVRYVYKRPPGATRGLILFQEDLRNDYNGPKPSLSCSR